MSVDACDKARSFVPDILDAMQAIRSFIAGMEYADFLDDLKTQYAVHYAFGIIGEAAKRVSAEVQASYRDVDWHGTARHSRDARLRHSQLRPRCAGRGVAADPRALLHRMALARTSPGRT